MLTRVAFIAFIVWSGLCWHLSTATACTVDLCRVTQGMAVPHDSTVPANLPAAIWHPLLSVGDQDKGLEQHIDIWQIDPHNGAVTYPITFTLSEWRYGSHYLPDSYILQFDTPLAANTEYLIQADLLACQHDAESDWFEASFRTGDAMPYPKALGKLVAMPETHRNVRLATSTSCHAPYNVVAITLILQWDASALPWQNALIFETYVDGQLWQPRHSLTEMPPPGASWNGRGSDTVYRICDTNNSHSPEWPGLSSGRHRVQLKARLPGFDNVFESNAIDIELYCPNDLQIDPSKSSPIRVDAHNNDNPTSATCSQLQERTPPHSTIVWVLIAIAFLTLRLYFALLPLWITSKTS